MWSAATERREDWNDLGYGNSTVSQLNQVGRARPAGVLVTVAAIVLTLAGVARADDPPPPTPLPPTAGIGQYVEDVPSAAGPRAAGQPD